MAQLTISVTGDKQTAVALDRLRETIGDDLTEPFQDIARELKSFFEGDVFESEGSAAGTKWAALSEPYATNKAKLHSGGILEATGALREGFTSLIQSDSMLFTNSVSYVVYHQMGTSKMPSRPVFQVNEEVAALIGRVFQKHVLKACEGFGRG